VFVVYERRRSVAQVYRKRIGGERDSRWRLMLVGQPTECSTDVLVASSLEGPETQFVRGALSNATSFLKAPQLLVMLTTMTPFSSFFSLRFIKQHF
jgi:hypothetical protein